MQQQQPWSGNGLQSLQSPTKDEKKEDDDGDDDDDDGHHEWSALFVPNFPLSSRRQLPTLTTRVLH